MLIEFRVSNFRSFRDEQVFSMVASADKELPNNLITDKALGKNRLLRSAVMYGANASGKSNLVKAIQFLQNFVKFSNNREIGAGIPVQPFVLDSDSVNKPTEFSITFIHNGIRYKYKMSITRQRVEFEELIAYPKHLPQVWYSRQYDSNEGKTTYKFGPSLKGERKQIQHLTRDDVLYLSNAASLNNTQLREVYDWFTTILAILDLSDLNKQNLFINRMSELIANNRIFRSTIVNWLQLTNTNITDVLSIENQDLSTKSTNSYNIYIGYSNSIPDLDVKYLALKEESLGTQRLFAIALPILAMFSSDACLIIDELDTSLHPLLVRTIIDLIHQSQLQKSCGQLFFNTHDTTLLDNSLFRRDQIWFAEKDKNGASQIFSLWDFSSRKEESFARGYLQGRYGGVPFFNDLVDLMGALVYIRQMNLGAQDGEAKAS